MAGSLCFLACLMLAMRAAARIHEPMCTKFDYDERLLEKLVRLEYKLDNLEEKFKQLEEIVLSRLDSIEAAGTEVKRSTKESLDAMKTDMLGEIAKEMSDRKAGLKDLQDDLKEQLEIVEGSLTQRTIAFMAQLSTHVTNPKKGQRIIFDDVITNEGGAYDNVQGMFTAPLSGVYNFNLIVSSASNTAAHDFHLHIQKNGVQTAYIFLDRNDRYWFRRSTDITLKLASGDQIWVMVHHANGPNMLGGCCFHSHFSGFLIGADEKD